MEWKPKWVPLPILDFARAVHSLKGDPKKCMEWVVQFADALMLGDADSSNELANDLIVKATNAYAQRSHSAKKAGKASAKARKNKSKEVAGRGNSRNESTTGLEEFAPTAEEYDQETPQPTEDDRGQAITQDAAIGNDAEDQDNRTAKTRDSHGSGRYQPPSLGPEDGTIDSPATDGDIREDSLNIHSGSNAARMESGTSAAGTPLEARESRRPGDGRKTRTAGISQPAVRPPPSMDRCAKIPIPPRNSEDVRLFALDKNLDVDDARMWYQMNFIDRPGCDKDGVVIINWKGHCTAYCKAEAERRKAG